MSNDTNILVTTLITSFLNNSCSESFLKFRCYELSKFSHTFAYVLLAFGLLPQIIHLFLYRNRYIAGISYLWIVNRAMILILLMAANAFKWLFILEFIAFISTIVVFIQIIIYSNNLHPQNKIILIIISLSILIIEKILIYFFIKQEHLLITIGYSLLAIEMLPQILLNSLLQTTKALSKFSLFLLGMSNLLLFFSLPMNRNSLIYSITLYYSLSFLLFIFIQKLFHSDAHIHLISRSTHTVLTPGIDIFTGLDINEKRSSGDDPHMFSLEDLESTDGVDVIYRPVTTNKSTEPEPIKKCFWFTTSGCIFSIETLITIILIYRIGSPWIILVPFSILFILGFFYLLRIKLNTLQIEILKNFL